MHRCWPLRWWISQAKVCPCLSSSIREALSSSWRGTRVALCVACSNSLLLQMLFSILCCDTCSFRGPVFLPILSLHSLPSLPFLPLHPRPLPPFPFPRIHPPSFASSISSLSSPASSLQAHGVKSVPRGSSTAVRAQAPGTNLPRNQLQLTHLFSAMYHEHTSLHLISLFI